MRLYYLSLYCQQDMPERHQLVIADLQVTVGLPEMSRFFLLTGESTSQSFYWKEGKLYILFPDAACLQKFLFSHIFTSRIQTHTFNIYPAIFHEPLPFLQYQFRSKNQLTPETLKEWHLKCTQPCRIRITYDHGVLCNVGFIDFLKESQFDQNAFREASQSLGIKLREVREGLRCSLSLWNYLSSTDEEQAKKQFMEQVKEWELSEVNGEADVSVIDGKTLIHFQCKDAPTTLKVFEYLRVKLLDVPDVRLSLFYFERESSCSQVLLIKNIVNVEGLKMKQFENKLLMMLRQIVKGVVYVSLKPAGDREGMTLFNGKIHMMDKQSGKQLLCGAAYQQIKQTMYMYFLNRELHLDLFKNKEDLAKMSKCINNTNQLMQKIKRVEQQQKQQTAYLQLNQYPQQQFLQYPQQQFPQYPQQFTQPRGYGDRSGQNQRREGQGYSGEERQREQRNRGYKGQKQREKPNKKWVGDDSRQEISSSKVETKKVADKPFKMVESDFPSL